MIALLDTLKCLYKEEFILALLATMVIILGAFAYLSGQGNNAKEAASSAMVKQRMFGGFIIFFGLILMLSSLYFFLLHNPLHIIDFNSLN